MPLIGSIAQHRSAATESVSSIYSDYMRAWLLRSKPSWLGRVSGGSVVTGLGNRLCGVAKIVAASGYAPHSLLPEGGVAIERRQLVEGSKTHSVGNQIYQDRRDDIFRSNGYTSIVIEPRASLQKDDTGI